MSATPPPARSSRSSTIALSQPPTLLMTASTRPSSPNNASTPSSTQISTPGLLPVAPSALERAVEQRQKLGSNIGAVAANGSLPALASTTAQGGASPTVTPLSSLSPKPTSSKVGKAIREFRNRMLGNEVLDFKGTTVEDLRREMRRIQKEQHDRRGLVNMRRIQGCIEAMDNFGRVIEVFLNVSDAVAFIWGPMKFLLLAASTVSESFETLLDAYERIGDQLPLMESYERLFINDDLLQGALELMYVDILDFHEAAVRFFRGKVWKKFFRSMWKDFNTKFGGILKSLSRHKTFVESCAQRAQYVMYQYDMADMKAANLVHFDQHQQNAKELNFKLDELVAAERIKKIKAVMQWLAAGQQFSHDHEMYRQIRVEYSRTTSWILQQTYIVDWINPAVPSTPVLWMHGIPGAGKTILASAIIDTCRTQPGFATAFYYCHSDDQADSSAVGILKGLTQQLLDCNDQLLPPCYTRYTLSGEPVLRSLSQAIHVLSDLCAILPKIYIVIDGLDECEQTERKQVADALLKIVDQCEKNDPGKLRVLFVSQNFTDIRRVLCSNSQSRPVTKIMQLSEKDNENDINTYVGAWVTKIAAKFAPFSDDLIEYLQRLTVHNAKGMFLYAKLVMENLYAQSTRGELMEGMRQDTFPEGLKGAYERILRHMQRASSSEEWMKAKKLLGWMICAKRRLTWKEIQVALSINVDDQTIEYDDRRLRKHIHDICGSLVSLNGDRVSLVHSTAKQYIKDSEGIHEPAIEIELATLCLRYLTFRCFDIDESDYPPLPQELQELALEGHLAFQDYAIAKWYYHVNAFVVGGADFMSLSKINRDQRDAYLEDMNIALEDFMTLYHDGNWDKSVVQDCQTSCTVFENHALHERLVKLTSHIYTVQKKGFDARHEISIKSLAEALTRNRKLLEELPLSKGIKQEDLVRYRRFYDDERRYKCTKITCRFFSEGFKDAKARKKHVNIHERPYQCDIPDCLGNEGFANQGDLQKHMRAYHPDMSDLAETFNAVAKPRAKSDHACTICGKTFTRDFARRNHENSHRNLRLYSCPECNKSFVRRHDCNRHQKIHERT